MLKYGLTAAALLAAALLNTAPAAALTMKECGAKYQDAKKANTLKGQTWAQFRKAECADDDESEDAAAAAVQEPAPKAGTAAAAAGQKPVATPATATTTQPAQRPAATAGKAKGPVFPKVVSAKFADEKPGRARLKTCAEQYNANKATNANGDLKWIEKGTTGYWSLCNARLKEAGA